MKSGRTASALILAACLAALAGCATASQAASTDPTPLFPEANYVGALPTPVTYKDGWIILTPPRAGDTPAVDWRDAYAHCGKDAVCEAGRIPTISYGRATVTGYGDIQADGSTVLRVEDRLVYLIQYNQSDGMQCPRLGPMQMSETPSEMPIAIPCSQVAYIDAMSGDPLGASSWSD
jgi:hypothetical protein